MSRYRHEYKYILDNCQKEILKVKVSGIMNRDRHVDINNRYVIRSLYLDNLRDQCLRENLAGSDNRTKFRVRYYNDNTGRIALEKKSKLKGMCLKEYCLISEDECNEIIHGNIPLPQEDDSDIRKKLLTEARLNGMIPAAIVTYTRTPFIYPVGNVRVTFDEDVTSSCDFKRFLSGGYTERPILESGQSILEVKWDALFPKHIKDIMSLENYTWTAFSKYGMCRIINQ